MESIVDNGNMASSVFKGPTMVKRWNGWMGKKCEIFIW